MESLGTSLKIYNLIDSRLIQDAKMYTNNQVPSVTKKKQQKTVTQTMSLWLTRISWNPYPFQTTLPNKEPSICQAAC